jgi:hypothetical protein
MHTLSFSDEGTNSWSRVLLEELVVSQLVKKFTVYGT